MRQAQALTVMMSGVSAFLTGAPGSGKSHVLNEFVRAARRSGRKVAVTASTGIAATHIGGVTVHSWSGLGVKDQLSQRDLDTLAVNARLVPRYLGTDVLVIDEISMLQGLFLDSLDRLAREVRGLDVPFGGLQVVFVGDMFQLPPISRGSNEADFAFSSRAWRDLDPEPCYLSEQHRHIGDELQVVLDAMRSNTLREEHKLTLRGRMGLVPPQGSDVTRLYSHNVDVDTINQRHLDALPSKSERFIMAKKGSPAAVEQLLRGMLAPAELELKVGAEVMFVANDQGKSYANGTLGRIVSLEDERPVVELASNCRKISVGPHTWQLEEDGHVRAEIKQLPLRLAWAITIHKSQGMSLDAAEIDLSRSFTPGMGYVALSRVRTLEGLYLSGMNSVALQLNERIFELDSELRAKSERLSIRTEDFRESIDSQGQESEVANQDWDESVLESLKKWRRNRARADGVPAYVISHDATLEEIARQLPQNEITLLRIRGMGQSRVATYGQDILQITTNLESFKAL